MTTDEMDRLDGPEMDALRELRADVPGPSQTQRQSAWERAQGARSQAGGRRPTSRWWITAGVAAVTAGVLAVGVVVASNGGGEEDTAPAASTSSVTTLPKDPDPTPFATGSVWEPTGAADQKVMDTYRDDQIHLLADGGVRIDLPPGLDWEAMNRALNREGIPIRIWSAAGAPGTWDTTPVIPIDGDKGVDMSADPGPTYPRSKVSAVTEGDRVVSLTFEEIPSEPADVTLYSAEAP